MPHPHSGSSDVGAKRPAVARADMDIATKTDEFEDSKRLSSDSSLNDTAFQDSSKTLSDDFSFLELTPILGLEEPTPHLSPRAQPSPETLPKTLPETLPETLAVRRDESETVLHSTLSHSVSPQSASPSSKVVQSPAFAKKTEDSVISPAVVNSNLHLVSSSDQENRDQLLGFRCEGIVKYWGRRQVLRGVDMRLGKGEIVGLLGPNGAGKTSLFQIMIGLVRPDKGRVILNGLDVSKAPMYRRARLGVGYLPQSSSVFRGMTVEQNILAVLELSERNSGVRAERTRELLDEFGIQHLRDAEASTLSGGEARRLEIARSLASKPNYILLDEPFAGIDPISIGEVKELVQGLKARGIGILITDHNVRDTLGLVDRGYIFYEGSILNEGQPSDLASSEDVQRVYLGAQFNF